MPLLGKIGKNMGIFCEMSLSDNNEFSKYIYALLFNDARLFETYMYEK